MIFCIVSCKIIRIYFIKERLPHSPQESTCLVTAVKQLSPAQTSLLLIYSNMITAHLHKGSQSHKRTDYLTQPTVGPACISQPFSMWHLIIKNGWKNYDIFLPIISHPPTYLLYCAPSFSCLFVDRGLVVVAFPASHALFLSPVVSLSICVQRQFSLHLLDAAPWKSIVNGKVPY